MRDRKNILIGALLFAIVAMSVGYAALSEELKISGTASVGMWNVEITEIKSEFTGNAKDATVPTFTSTSATFNTELPDKGDTATYTITVSNKGKMDARLSSINWSPQNDSTSSPIIFTIVSQPATNSILTAGQTAEVVIEAKYDPNYDGEINEVNMKKEIAAIIEYVQAN